MTNHAYHTLRVKNRQTFPDQGGFRDRSLRLAYCLSYHYTTVQTLASLREGSPNEPRVTSRVSEQGWSGGDGSWSWGENRRSRSLRISKPDWRRFEPD